MKLVFATNNKHKLKEIREIIGDRIEILSLNDIGCNEDIPENGDTLEKNALQKTRFIKERLGYDCFADDTGLEVDALKGAPGVYSARYASSEGHDSVANMNLLLKNMKGKTDRSARFRTVIALLLNGEEYLFEGEVKGSITESPRGSDGFGYDPVFEPEGEELTFAEMDASLKNSMSHRRKGIEKLIKFLTENK